MKHVALLRGINVGGKNKLSMKDLNALFDRAGCTEVRNYIQSGNVVFAAPAALARRIPGLIETEIERGFRLRVPVVLRSDVEMRAIAAANPLVTAGADPARFHVVFLADPPAAKDVASLDPARSPPDTFVVRGREIYLSCPNGIGQSKLTTAYFDTKLGTVGTVRNWRTVLTLVEMLGG